MKRALRDGDPRADENFGWATYNPPIEVEFEDGGYAEGMDNPQALNVRLKSNIDATTQGKSSRILGRVDLRK